MATRIEHNVSPMTISHIQEEHKIDNKAMISLVKQMDIVNKDNILNNSIMDFISKDSLERRCEDVVDSMSFTDGKNLINRSKLQDACIDIAREEQKNINSLKY